MAESSTLDTTEMHSQIFKVRLEPTGVSFDAPAFLSLLRASELSSLGDLKIQSSCRNGTCRACMCQLISGQVVYQIDWPGLSYEEKREGYILPCVASALSDVVITLP